MVNVMNRYMRHVGIGTRIVTSVLKGGDGLASLFGFLELDCLYYLIWYVLSQLVEALRYKPIGRGFEP